MSSIEDIQKLITEHQRRLQKLRVQQALQGTSTPPEILLEIEDIEAKLRELEAELAKLEEPQSPSSSDTDSKVPAPVSLPRQDAEQKQEEYPEEKQVGLPLGGGNTGQVYWWWALLGLVGMVVVIGFLYQASQTPTPTNTPAPPINTPTPTRTPKPPTYTPTPAGPQAGEVRLDGRGVPMVYIPAGPFTMGDSADVGLAECRKYWYKPNECKRDSYTDEEPAHTVTLDAYYLDQYEVTNARYAECVQAQKCAAPGETKSYTRANYYGNPQYNDYPVITVDWNQAKAYCEWRGGRLPTEAEWEKAARGTDGRTYPWGNEFDGSRVNFCDKNCTLEWANKNYDDGYADTAPVGSYPGGVSPYGVYDLAGNVWEWVNDWYGSGYYGGSPATNPLGPTNGDSRVRRGGGLVGNPSRVRAAGRFGSAPYFKNDVIGFRCARSQ